MNAQGGQSSTEDSAPLEEAATYLDGDPVGSLVANGTIVFLVSRTRRPLEAVAF